MLALGITIAVMIMIILGMPKRLTLAEYYITSLFAFLLNATADFSLNLQHDYYGYFKEGVDIEGYLIVYVIGPCINILYLNFFPRTRGIGPQVLYLLVWCLFSIAYEVYVALPNGMIYYNKWKWWYSAIAYPLLFFILAAHWSWVRTKLLKLQKAQDK
jgi:hypothetical protein